MSDLKKIFVGQKIKKFPAHTWNKLLAGELRDRSRQDHPSDIQIGSPHSQVITRLRWEGASDIGPGAVVKLTNSIFIPDTDEFGGSYGLGFACVAFGEGDPLDKFAITLGPIESGGESIGYGVIPEAWWAKVDIADEAHTHATNPIGTQLQSSTSGLRILWKPTGTGVKWAVLLLGGSGGTSSTVDVKIVLIDDDIPGVQEYNPAEFLEADDIPLTEEEVTDGYTVVFQDPPDDDYDENHVDNLNLWAYVRRQVTLKYFTSDPLLHSGTANDVDTATIQLSSFASEVDDFYVGHTITLTGGLGDGQDAIIIAYDGATQTATVDDDWATEPDNTTEYEITSTLDRILATTIIDDDSDPENPRKIVRYATTSVYYDDGVPFEVGEYTRLDYPDYPENEVFPPDGEGTYEELPGGFLKKRYRGIVVGGVLITALCKALPPPPLPEAE